MADEKNDDKGTEKEFSYKGDVTDETEGKSYEVEGEATVTPIEQAPSKQVEDGEGTVVQVDTFALQCRSCDEPLTNGVCMNADCELGQKTASVGAARDTAKVAAGSVAATQPRAFTRSGGVD